MVPGGARQPVSARRSVRASRGTLRTEGRREGVRAWSGSLTGGNVRGRSQGPGSALQQGQRRTRAGWADPEPEEGASLQAEAEETPAELRGKAESPGLRSREAEATLWEVGRVRHRGLPRPRASLLGVPPGLGSPRAPVLAAERPAHPRPPRLWGWSRCHTGRVRHLDGHKGLASWGTDRT